MHHNLAPVLLERVVSTVTHDRQMRHEKTAYPRRKGYLADGSESSAVDVRSVSPGASSIWGRSKVCPFVPTIGASVLTQSSKLVNQDF
jgi:hypothetical protein